MQTYSVCLIAGHEDCKESRICIFKECNQLSRWCCDECLLNKIHLHGQLGDNHLIGQQEFILYINREYQQEEYNIASQQLIIKNSLIKLNNVIQHAKKLISYLEKLYDSILQSHATKYSTLIKLANNDFPNLEKTLIDDLLIFRKPGIQQDQQDAQESLKSIMNSCQDLQQLFRSSENVYNYSPQFFQQQDQKIKHESQFELKESMNIYTLQISPNEQLIAYGGNNKTLTIIDLTTQQKVKEIKFDNDVRRCQFTDDSKIIYCVDYDGYLYGYDNQYKEFYKNQMHEEWITAINIINNFQVVSCSDYSLIISDTQNNQQLLKIPNPHISTIYNIEYDTKNQMTISCSYDQSIKFVLITNGDIIIDQQNAHNDEIYQIQLINSNLLSRSKRELRQWQVDYQNKKLILINILVESEDVFGFASLLNDTILVKNYQKYFQVLDVNSRIISQHDHNIDQLWIDSRFNQTDTMNFILIMGRCQIKVLKRVQ